MISIIFTSCSKSNDQKPPIADSSYVINGLSIFIGGDSSNWNQSTRNLYTFDSIKNQLTQTITEFTFGDPNGYTYHIIYQYDETKRLQSLIVDRNSYIYKSMNFEYGSGNQIQKVLITDQNDAVIENDFTQNTENGNTIIMQYDTISSNLGKGDYSANRPAITSYTFNDKGKIIRQYSICSELYNGRPAYEDTLDTRFVYDANNRLTQTTTNNTVTDNQGHLIQEDDIMQFNHDETATSHINDFALATLRNMEWLVTSDYVSLFKNLYSIQYGYLSREEPLISTYDSFGDLTYSTNYQNEFDSLGLLQNSSAVKVEKNNINLGNTTRESHYFTYLKINK
ncbi:MAG TPA: hypothetical protein VK711_10040 [Puia sp.]|nr:hypothetical protein [Puia sp.]